MRILPPVRAVVVTCLGQQYVIMKTTADQFGVKRGQEVDPDLLNRMVKNMELKVNLLTSAFDIEN